MVLSVSSMSTPPARERNSGNSIMFLIYVPCLATESPLKRMMPITIQNNLPHIALQFGPDLDMAHCPQVGCAVDRCAALRTGNFPIFSALAKPRLVILQESSGFLCFPFLWHFFHRNHDSCSAGTFLEPPQESEYVKINLNSSLRYVDSAYIFLRLRTDLFEFVPFVSLLLLLPLPPTLPLTSPPLAGIGKAVKKSSIGGKQY